MYFRERFFPKNGDARPIFTPAVRVMPILPWRLNKTAGLFGFAESPTLSIKNSSNQIVYARMYYVQRGLIDGKIKTLPEGGLAITATAPIKKILPGLESEVKILRPAFKQGIQRELGISTLEEYLGQNSFEIVTIPIGGNVNAVLVDNDVSGQGITSKIIK